MIKIDLIAGARPNFIKIAPIINKIEEKYRSKFKYRLIHTGQHYDKRMSDSFFEQLEIPDPDVNLNVGSASQAQQTAGIMIGYEKYLKNTYIPDICLVVGDVNSTMACSIVVKKLGAKVAHVEAGIRSHDQNMPEEINRIITDSITDYFFTTSTTANKNLLKSGYKKNQIFFVGNVMIDTLKKFESKLIQPTLWKKHDLKKSKYFVLTLHRPSNVDEPKKLLEILKEIDKNCNNNKIIYPVHPRVSKIINNLDINFKNIIQTEALSYLHFNYLVKNSKAVITDSGGITEEATMYDIPCLTLRKNTERPETVEIGTNVLIKDFPKDFRLQMNKINSGEWKKSRIPEKWDGNTASRIINHLIRIFE